MYGIDHVTLGAVRRLDERGEYRNSVNMHVGDVQVPLAAVVEMNEILFNAIPDAAYVSFTMHLTEDRQVIAI